MLRRISSLICMARSLPDSVLHFTDVGSSPGTMQMNLQLKQQPLQQNPPNLPLQPHQLLLNPRVLWPRVSKILSLTPTTCRTFPRHFITISRKDMVQDNRNYTEPAMRFLLHQSQNLRELVSRKMGKLSSPVCQNICIRFAFFYFLFPHLFSSPRAARYGYDIFWSLERSCYSCLHYCRSIQAPKRRMFVRQPHFLRTLLVSDLVVNWHKSF